jgi:hypothetical protein
MSQSSSKASALIPLLQYISHPRRQTEHLVKYPSQIENDIIKTDKHSKTKTKTKMKTETSALPPDDLQTGAIEDEVRG